MFDKGRKQRHVGKLFAGKLYWGGKTDRTRRVGNVFGAVWSGEGCCNILGASHVSLCSNVRAKLEQLMLGFGSFGYHLGTGIGRPKNPKPSKTFLCKVPMTFLRQAAQVYNMGARISEVLQSTTLHISRRSYHWCEIIVAGVVTQR